MTFLGLFLSCADIVINCKQGGSQGTIISNIVKMQKFFKLIAWTSDHISDNFNCCSPNINGMGSKRSYAGYTKYLNLNQPKLFMCRYRVNQHVIALNLYSVLISKILFAEFITAKASQNLYLMLT